VLMPLHPHPRSVEDDAFSLKPEPLLQAIFTRTRDPATGADHAMPGQPARCASQCPDHLTGAARKAGRARDFAVGGYLALGNSTNRVADYV